MQHVDLLSNLVPAAVASLSLNVRSRFVKLYYATSTLSKKQIILNERLVFVCSLAIFLFGSPVIALCIVSYHGLKSRSGLNYFFQALISQLLKLCV